MVHFFWRSRRRRCGTADPQREGQKTTNRPGLREGGSCSQKGVAKSTPESWYFCMEAPDSLVGVPIEQFRVSWANSERSQSGRYQRSPNPQAESQQLLSMHEVRGFQRRFPSNSPGQQLSGKCARQRRRSTSPQPKPKVNARQSGGQHCH